MPSIGAVIHEDKDTELLKLNIQHHKSIGIQYFLICVRDPDSDWENSFHEISELPNVTVSFQPIVTLEENPMGLAGMREIGFERMVSTYSPDWVTVIDTDEFIVPATPSLPCLLRSCQFDTYSLARFNAALPSGFDFDQFKQTLGVQHLHRSSVISNPMTLDWEFMTNHPDVPWVMHKIQPKFITKLTNDVVIGPGFHHIGQRHIQPARKNQTNNDILIYHLPFTTLRRFADKIRRVRRFLAKAGHSFKGNQAWHWKRLAGYHGNNSLVRGEFDRQFFHPREMGHLINQGLVKDIQGLFRTRNAAPVTKSS